MFVPLSRPPRYHTPRSAPLALLALRRLWAMGLTDARVAEILSGLSAEAIQQLQRDGWTIEAAEDLAAAVLAAGEQAALASAWTRRQVLHHRRRLGQAARSDGLAAARFELAHRRRRHQAECGWGHLLPSADAPERGGFCLRRREVEVLCLLRDRGPLTRGELLAAMGVRRLMARGRSMLAHLERAGLIRAERQAGRPDVFELAEAAGWSPPADEAEPADE